MLNNKQNLQALATKEITMQSLLNRIMKKAKFTIEAGEEMIPVDGNLGDSKKEAWAKEQLENGNQWPWCFILITAKLGPLEAFSRLPGASYTNKVDFLIKPICDSMKVECVKEIYDKIDTVREKLDLILHTT